MPYVEHDCQLGIRLSNEDRDTLRRIAERREETISDLLRDAIHIIVDADRKERERNVFVRRADLTARTTQRGRKRSPVPNC